MTSAITLTLRKAALVLGLSLVASVAFAKLPPAPPLDPAKAEEAKAKAAEAAKKEADLMTKYQDKVAERYASELKAKGKEFKPWVAPAAPTAAAPATPPTGAPAPTAAAAAVPAAPAK